jgi:hypothetical protein
MWHGANRRIESPIPPHSLDNFPEIDEHVLKCRHGPWKARRCSNTISRRSICQRCTTSANRSPSAVPPTMPGFNGTPSLGRGWRCSRLRAAFPAWRAVPNLPTQAHREHVGPPSHHGRLSPGQFSGGPDRTVSCSAGARSRWSELLSPTTPLQRMSGQAAGDPVWGFCPDGLSPAPPGERTVSPCQNEMPQLSESRRLCLCRREASSSGSRGWVVV